MKLYGPSDVEVIKFSDKHMHSFLKASQRVLAPEFGDDNRSLPVVDCAECEDWCLKEGWASNPKRVVRTADEQEYVRDSKEQGSIYMRGIMEGMGRNTAAATEDGVPARTSKARR